MAFEMKNKPEISFINIVAAGLIYLGFLMFLFAIHLNAIQATGDEATVLVTAFRVMLTIYVSALILGIVTIMIQLLRWVTWYTQTPEWQRKDK